MLERLYEKYTKKKVYLGAAILLIIINILTVFMIYKVNTSFTIGDQKFRYVSDKRYEVLFKDDEGNEVNIHLVDTGRSSLIDIVSSKYQIEYKDKVIGADFSNWLHDGIIINQSNGKEYKMSISEYRNYSDVEHGPFDKMLVYKINNAYSFAKDKSLVLIMIFIIFPFIFLGLAGIMYPEEMWRFNHMFTVRGGEPTDWAIFSSKLGGIIVIVFALLLPLSVL